jgi:Fe-S cluster biogenesis protein NfuA
MLNAQPALHQLDVVTNVIEDYRSVVRHDGGDIELVAVDGDRIRVRLKGACVDCAMAGQTLGRLRRRLTEALGRPVMVAPAAD